MCPSLVRTWCQENQVPLVEGALHCQTQHIGMEPGEHALTFTSLALSTLEPRACVLTHDPSGRAVAWILNMVNAESVTTLVLASDVEETLDTYFPASEFADEEWDDEEDGEEDSDEDDPVDGPSPDVRNHNVPAPLGGIPGRFVSAPEWIRTTDTGFRRAVLYPLSYGGAKSSGQD